MSDVVWDKKISDVNPSVLASLDKPHPSYYVALTVSVCCLILGAVAWGIQIALGTGMSGLNSPVNWGCILQTLCFGLGLVMQVR